MDTPQASNPFEQDPHDWEQAGYAAEHVSINNPAAAARANFQINEAEAAESNYGIGWMMSELRAQLKLRRTGRAALKAREAVLKSADNIVDDAFKEIGDLY